VNDTERHAAGIRTRLPSLSVDPPTLHEIFALSKNVHVSAHPFLNSPSFAPLNRDKFCSTVP